MATAGEIVTAVVNRYGFDVSETEALALVNERHKTMVVRAEMLVPVREVGPTVADQAEYALSALTADIRQVKVDGTAIDYTTAWQGDVYDTYPNGYTYWSAHPKASGTLNLHISPAPSEDGLSILVRAVERPDDLETNQRPLVPEEYHRAIREGVAASLMAEDAEQAGVADRLEARFDNACEELRRQLRRGRRAGPAEIKLWWP